MNLKKELVKTFKNILNVYFEKVYTSDEIKISAKEVGGKVEMIGADGTLSVAPDGDYVMDDGFSFSVKDGLIVSIVGEEQPVEEVAAGDYKDKEDKVSGDTEDVKAEEVEIEIDPEKEEMKKQIAELYKMFEELYSMLDGIKIDASKKNEAITQFSKEISDLNNNIKTLAKVPVEFSKTSKNNVIEETREQKLMDVARLIGKIK